MSARAKQDRGAIAGALGVATVIGVVVALAGCGASGAGAHGTTPRAGEDGAIARVRAEAAARPDDPAAQRALAEWEAFGEGGDPARVAAALARADALAPRDPGLAYVRAVLAEQHGEPEAALAAALEVIARAAESEDPIAPFYAESTLAYLHDLTTDAPRFRERVRPALEALVARPGHLGFAVRRQAMLWLRDLAQQRGDVAETARIDALAGCAASARVAGPFGPAILTPFDETLAAEQRGPLAERYDLGPGRGETETRRVEARHCVLPLGEGRASGAGVRVVESTIRAPRAGRHVIALAAGGSSAQISIDGAVVARVDRRNRWIGGVTFHALDLEAGEHELEIKLASRHATPGLGWMIDRAEGGYDPERGLVAPDVARQGGPLARFAVADVLFLRGDTVDARELLRRTLSDRSAAPVLALGARVAAADPFVPETRRQDEERRLLALAAERDPGAYWPAMRIAELETGELEALAAMRAVADRFPALASIQLRLAGALAEAGYDADADAAIERARGARADACTVIGARFRALADRGRFAPALELARALVACDARDETLFELAMDRHDWASASAELERLQPLLTRERHRLLGIRLAAASGDRATEQRLTAEREAEGEPGQYVLASADRRYAASDRAGAIRLLEAEAARAPREAGDLRRLTYALSGRDVMEPYRVDGLDVIRRFEASGRAYEGYASVLVFDYMVTRIFEDGSAIDLVHQIHRVQTAEGVERMGTLSVPGRALTVRVVSREGRVREPDEIEGSIDMPPLSVGDYVEYEFVREAAPRWGDAYLSDGWVFQSFSSPFDHSEMVYVAPSSMDVRFDARGPTPPPTTREANGLRTYRFVMTERRALTREPNALADPPILPSLRAGVRVSWDRMFEAVRDRMLDGDAVDPEAERLLAGTILAGAPERAGAREKARRIHRWVMENVDEAQDSFFGSAPLMLAARRGNRLRVVRYLLELAGVPARIAFARDLAGERPSAEVPDTRVYGHGVVVADVGGEPLYLLTAGRDLPHDFFPPGLRGQEAIVLAQGLPRITLPASQGGPALAQRVRGEIEVDHRGGARVHLVLALSGAAGAEMRAAIRQVPPAERATILAERFVPSVIPGGVSDPRSIAIRGLDDWESDLELEFAADTNGLVRPARGGIFLLPIFTSGIESNYARLPTRTTTELVGEVDLAVSLVVRGPGRIRTPDAAQLSGPAGALASLAYTPEPGGAVRLERRVRIPLAAIPVADYPAFAQFCRATTQLEERTVAFTPN